MLLRSRRRINNPRLAVFRVNNSHISTVAFRTFGLQYDQSNFGLCEEEVAMRNAHVTFKRYCRLSFRVEKFAEQ